MPSTIEIIKFENSFEVELALSALLELRSLLGGNNASFVSNI
jgi:hypothetical protein